MHPVAFGSRTARLGAGLLMLALSLSVLPAIAASTQQREDGACIRVSRVSGWSVVDRNVIEVTVGVNSRYHVSLSPAAIAPIGLRSTDRIGFVPDSTGRLCALGGQITAEGRRIPVTGIARVDDPTASEP